MANLNKVTLIGNLTRDPEVRYTPKGTAVGDLGIAVNRRVQVNDKWQDETTFVDITVWAQSAEYCQKYLTKGASIFVEGRLQMDTWEDKESGQKRSKLKVVAESVQGLDRKGSDGGRDVPPGEARGQGQQAPRDNGAGQPNQDEEDDSDIPF